jgi:hypothetical protein
VPACREDVREHDVIVLAFHGIFRAACNEGEISPVLRSVISLVLSIQRSGCLPHKNFDSLWPYPFKFG